MNALTPYPQTSNASVVPGPGTTNLARKDRKEIERNAAALTVALSQVRNTTVLAASEAEARTLVGLRAQQGRQMLAEETVRAPAALITAARNAIAAEPAAADSVARIVAAVELQIVDGYQAMDRALVQRAVDSILSI